MPFNSYNESQHEESELRHLLIPTRYALIGEAVVAVVILILLNLSTLSRDLLSDDSEAMTNPLSAWGQSLDKLLDSTQFVFAQRALLFGLWALVGALLYILVFRSLQIFIRMRGSVQQGKQLIQTEHAQGAWRWFASLHDFFLRTIVVVIGVIALLVGVLVCFAIASQELTVGLNNGFPENIGALALSLLAAFLAVRITLIGVSFLVPRFRVWYNA